MSELKIMLACRLLFIVAILVITFSLGFFRMKSFQSRLQISTEQVVGYIQKPVEIRDGHQYVDVYFAHGEPITLILPLYPQYQRGEWVSIQKNNEVGVFYNSEVKKLKSPGFIIEGLNLVRSKIIELTSKGFSEPFDSLVLGIVFGIDFGLERSVQDQMRSAGVIHILVASGYNVGLLVSISAKFFKRFGKLLLLVLTICVILFYGSLSGFESPIFRSVLMALGAMVSSLVGRQSASYLWLVYSALGMLLIWPKLYASISFQLSFVATWGLLTIGEVIRSYLKTFPSLIAESVGSSISAFVSTMPILLFHFGYIPTWGIVANVLIGLLLPIIFVLSLCSLGLIFLFPSMSAVIVLPTELTIETILSISQILK